MSHTYPAWQDEDAEQCGWCGRWHILAPTYGFIVGGSTHLCPANCKEYREDMKRLGRKQGKTVREMIEEDNRRRERPLKGR